jgi:hypothetical protein
VVNEPPTANQRRKQNELVFDKPILLLSLRLLSV